MLVDYVSLISFCCLISEYFQEIIYVSVRKLLGINQESVSFYGRLYAYWWTHLLNAISQSNYPSPALCRKVYGSSSIYKLTYTKTKQCQDCWTNITIQRHETSGQSSKINQQILTVSTTQLIRRTLRLRCWRKSERHDVFQLAKHRATALDEVLIYAYRQ
jgi:hypothetical protein